MTLEEVTLKVERFLAGLEKDELYLLRGTIVECPLFLEKIDKRIVYLENLPLIGLKN